MVSKHISCLFFCFSVFCHSINQEVRRGCTKPPQLKRLPSFLFFFVFFKRANEAIPRGLILTHLYAFVRSKHMCVFSPLLFFLCVADSSQDLTESSHCRAQRQAPSPHVPFLFSSNGLKLLHPRLLTGLPGTIERISTQIKQLCSRGAKDLKPD